MTVDSKCGFFTMAPNGALIFVALGRLEVYASTLFADVSAVLLCNALFV